MTQANQPYTSKDGRIHWLTQMPSDWELVPSKWLFDESKERAHEGDEQLSATQAYGVILQRDYEEREGRQVVHVFKHLDKRKHVEVDDFVISMRSFQGGLEIARAHGAIRSSYVVLKPGPDVHPPFFAHLFKSGAYIQALQATSNFIRDGQDLNFGNFVLVNLPRIPLSTQRLIADFLDRKTAAIDALIEKKERLVALLAEKRAALIHQAVTKGLDPNVPMKDSGVPWIGEIPAHWAVKRLKFVAQVRGGVTKGRRFDDQETVMLPYLRVANVQDGYLDLEVVSNIEILRSEVSRYTLKVGDILMNEGGDNDKLGRGCVWEGAINLCLHQNHVFSARPFRTTNPYWVSQCTSASYLRFFFLRRANQTTNLASISSSNLKEAPILWPPREEQARILAWLSTQTRNIDHVMFKLDNSLSRLREYRQALITAAVTGQLDITSESTHSSNTDSQLGLF